MKFWLTAISMLLFTSGTVRAESGRAAITGTVRDASGAVIEGAEVIAVNSANSLQESAITNEIGVFNLRNLPVGEYTLTCSMVEFANYRHTGINLAINQVAEIDIVLTIGTNTKTVTVTGDAPQLQTQTASISTNLSNDAITELPLNVQGGRNLSSFMFAYVPGVEGTDYDSHILGSLSKNKEVMIDGTSAVSQIGGYISESSPPMEAVREFQVTTAGIRADEGRTGGGVFRYDMKSGGNAWHGSGFLYMHNEAFDAESWGNATRERLSIRELEMPSRETSFLLETSARRLKRSWTSTRNTISRSRRALRTTMPCLSAARRPHTTAISSASKLITTFPGIIAWVDPSSMPTSRGCFPTKAASGRQVPATEARWPMHMTTIRLRRRCASKIPGRFRAPC
jgi:hypothetical protein